MKLFFTSEEVATHFNLPASTIEHYVRFFNLKINKVGKNRKFNHQNMEVLGKIIQLVQEEGHTLEGAKDKLKEKVVQSNKNEELINRLTEVRKTLIILKEKFA